MSINFLNHIEKNIGISIAIADKTQTIIYENDFFKHWFKGIGPTNSIKDRFTEIDINKLIKTIETRDFILEYKTNIGRRDKIIKVCFSKLPGSDNELIFIKGVDYTIEKENEFMMDSYIRIAEKNKKNLEKANEEILFQKKLIESKNEEILDSINYAKRIQSAILPEEKVIKTIFNNFFIYYKPKDIISGDFYWFEKSGDLSFFAVADCTGHGVPGALVSIICSNGLNRAMREHELTDPGKILDKTREIVVDVLNKNEQDVSDGMDITLCVLNHKTNELTCAGANNSLWIIRNKELIELKGDKQPIGYYLNPQPFITHTIQLQRGDALYLFSDGYKDQFGGEKRKKLGTANFKSFLLSIDTDNMSIQKEILDQMFLNWKGNIMQIDDVCVIGISI